MRLFITRAFHFPWRCVQPVYCIVSNLLPNCHVLLIDVHFTTDIGRLQQSTDASMCTVRRWGRLLPFADGPIGSMYSLVSYPELIIPLNYRPTPRHRRVTLAHFLPSARNEVCSSDSFCFVIYFSEQCIKIKL